MTTSKRFSLAIGSSLGLLLSLAAARPLTAQAAPQSDLSTWQQVFVDDQCQVLSSDSGRFQSDPDVCHLDGMGVHNSSHVAAKEVDGVRQHTMVNVSEQTYLLQNIHAEPVVFVVAKEVPDGWYVDSDMPRPEEIKAGVAIFRVTAQPGQTVRMHVGLAHETPMDDQK